MTGGVKEGWAWVSDRPFWLLGWALSLCAWTPSHRCCGSAGSTLARPGSILSGAGD